MQAITAGTMPMASVNYSIGCWFIKRLRCVACQRTAIRAVSSLDDYFLDFFIGGTCPAPPKGAGRYDPICAHFLSLILLWNDFCQVGKYPSKEPIVKFAGEEFYIPSGMISSMRTSRLGLQMPLECACVINWLNPKVPSFLCMWSGTRTIKCKGPVRESYYINLCLKCTL